MSLQTYLAFVTASVILLIIPGPTVLMVVGHALTHGARRTFWSVIGVALGDTTALGCSLLGLGAFLQTSAHLFTLLKWAGAVYLVITGIRMIRTAPAAAARAEAGFNTNAKGLRLLCQAYLVTALNPKTILFFVAFVPQFITPGPDVHTQMLIILGTFVGLAIVNSTAYALLAGSARSAARSPSVVKTLNRMGGGVFVAAGLWTAAKEA